MVGTLTGTSRFFIRLLGFAMFTATYKQWRSQGLPGWGLTHPEGQNEEENKKSLRKNKKNWSKFEEKMRKAELLPTQNELRGWLRSCL